MSQSITLQRACPLCRQTDTVTLRQNHVQCQAEGCTFDVQFGCPLCYADLKPESFNETGFRCPSCKTDIALRKIQHLIENSLVVDHEMRCRLCNGPTLHRPDANLGHRCFHFPKCSGQAGLFGQAQESFVFLDFETTGLEPSKEHIIEIGALKIDEDGYEHVFQQFIKPPKPVGAHITQITGITDEMLENAPPLEDVMRAFIAFIGNAKIVAHNAEFDIPWLITAAMRTNETLKNNPVICTLKWARRAKEPRASLGILTKKYKITHANAHRALADACSTRELFLIFENQYASERMDETLEIYRAFCEKLLQH